MCSTKFDDVLYIPTKFKLFMSNVIVRNLKNRNEKTYVSQIYINSNFIFPIFLVKSLLFYIIFIKFRIIKVHIFPQLFYVLHHITSGCNQGFFLSILGCCHMGNYSQEEVAKFGYMSKRKF
jgi:hypothetical protein